MSKIRVLLVDDHTLLREGIRSLLSLYEDVEVVGEARDGAEALVRVDELRPDIALMDIAMPRLNGLEATRRICAEHPKTRVLVLTQSEDREYVVSMLQAGAAGYVLKDTAATELVAAMRAIHAGQSFLHPAAAMAVVEQVQHQAQESEPVSEPLTAREREILAEIALGKTSAQIAIALSLSVKTVKWHRTNLMSKLGVHGIASLVRYALDHGLVEPMK